MFSFVNRMDAGRFKRTFVFALVGVVLGGMLAPTTVAARDAKRPYVIPGDADGPAGVQDAVVVLDRADSEALPFCVPLGPRTVRLIVLQVDLAGALAWFRVNSPGARSLEDSKR